MATVILQRTWRAEDEPGAASEAARRHLERLAYEVVETAPVLLLRRGSDWGSRFSAAPRSWLAELQLAIHPGARRGSEVLANLTVTVPGEPVSERDRKALETELDGIVAALTGQPVPPPQARAQVAAQQATARRVHSAAVWFYLIAAMSIINSLMVVANLRATFLAGLGATQLVDALAGSLSQGVDGGALMLLQGIALVLNLAIAAVFALVGWLGSHGSRRAFYVGMLLFALDALILVFIKDYVGVVYHLFVLYMLYNGLRAGGQPPTHNKTGRSRS